MTDADPEALVPVYSTPNPFDAEIVKNMLADEGIGATVENATGAFPGLTTIPARVLVLREHEAAALQLVAEHEEEHRKHVDEKFDEEAAGIESDDDETSEV